MANRLRFAFVLCLGFLFLASGAAADWPQWRGPQRNGISNETGNVRWQKSVRKDFGDVPGQWAYSESPLIDGDVVVVTPGGEEATMVALNKNATGIITESLKKNQ